MTQQKRPMNETMVEIVHGVALFKRATTRSEICAYLNRRNSPHIIDMVEQQCEQGYLTVESVLLHTGKYARGYKVTGKGIRYLDQMLGKNWREGLVDGDDATHSG